MGWLSFNDPNSYDLQSSSQVLRPGAKAGLWCSFILPIASLLSATHQSQVSAAFQLCVATSCVSAMYLIARLYRKTGFWTHMAIILTMLVLNKYVLLVDLRTAIRFTCIAVLCNVRSFQILISILESFPLSFSLGEAMFVVQGAITFLATTVANCFDEKTVAGIVFSKILLLAIVIFLGIVGQITWLQQFIPFVGFFLMFMGVITLPLIGFLISRNPITWFFTEFIFVSSTRVYVLLFWGLCTVTALAIAWHHGNGHSTHALTILRKYFHAVVVAIYLPGILFDIELLYCASVIVLAGFLFLEALRLLGPECISNVLNQKMAGFLDEKDSGKLILTHIYLLVGCSIPIWLFPDFKPNDARELLLVCSGIISLGIGDAAASVGGTWWGRTKIFGGSKSLEGTLSSVVAEITFVLFLYFLGIVKTDNPLTLFLRFLFVASLTSTVEAVTTQVDNLVLPLVMYIGLIIF